MVTSASNKQYIHMTVNGNKYAFLGKGSIYRPLTSQLGIDSVEENLEDGYTKLSQKQLIRNGKAIKITVTGTLGQLPKTGKLIVPIDKADTALEALIGQRYGGWRINQAYQSGDNNTTY